MGDYEVIDFVVMLMGYAVSGEPTIKAFYQRLLPFAEPFMALFGRAKLPHRGTLSRFLAALDETPVEALRTLFQEDLVARATFSCPPGGIWDRQGRHWTVVDVDATKQAARQRALPQTPELPAPHRRCDLVAAPAYLGRKRGEVARTRTTVLQSHTHQWLGTFGNAGNGDYRGELRRAKAAIKSYASSLALPLSHVLTRLDGLYGNAAPLADLLTENGPGVIVRGKQYHLLDLPQVRTRLQHPADQQVSHPESGTRRALFDCPDIALTPTGPIVRMIVASHPATSTAPSIGVVRDEMVYEQFFTTVPQEAFTPADVLDLYLHRGSFETVLADEDLELDPDRWASHTPCGQEFWQILCQWIWNLRLELGQHVSATTMRLTELSYSQIEQPVPGERSAQGDESVQSGEPVQDDTSVQSDEPVRYGPPQWARRSYTKGFAGADFPLQPDGTLLCPADHPLYPQERRLERNGSLRVLYAARIGHCRGCSLRSQCQENDTTTKPRRVSAVFWPLASAAFAPNELTPDEPSSDMPAFDEPTSDMPVSDMPAFDEPTSDMPVSDMPAFDEPTSDRPAPGMPALDELASDMPAFDEPTSDRPMPALDELASDMPALDEPTSDRPASDEPEPSSSVLWGDWERCQIRRRWFHLLRTQMILFAFGPLEHVVQEDLPHPDVQTRAQRAHWRLSWKQRLARNARPSHAPPLEVTVHGLPVSFAQSFGFDVVPAA
jgi:hypothetical protein